MTQVFDDMRREEPKDLSKSKSWDKIRFGNLVENWIGDLASRMIGIDVFNDPYMLGNRQHPWICCNKDFHVVENDKYPGRWPWKQSQHRTGRYEETWDSGLKILSQYYIQMQHHVRR